MFDDEKPTSIFLKTETSKGYSEVTRLRIPNKFFNDKLPEHPLTNIKYFIVTDQSLIRLEMQAAFQSIYNKQDMLATSSNDLLNFLNSDNDIRPTRELMQKRLTPHMANSMEGLLTEEELEHALFFKMKGSSSPGLDGFTVNHLRVFWYDLKGVIKDGLNCMFRDKLTSTLRTAVVKLLRKGLKDPTLTGNYRPISLLSIFYKLASCAITQRIKPAVESILGKQQKAYINKNNIGSCIVNLVNMMHHVNKAKKLALILLIDFKKAFDSIDLSFMETVLKTMGFGKYIREWIRLFFSGREAYILMGGHLTEKIILEQGVPQGDVVSPYVFILMVEVLLIKINHTANIEGINFAKTEGRSETFADDTTIYITRSEKNLRNCVKYISAFATISGLQCNLDKTLVIPLGGNYDVTDVLCKDLDLKWQDNFTILGFDIDSKLLKLDANFDKAHKKVNGIISKWQGYKLSLDGRITITKSLLLSQYTYIASVLDMPVKMFEKIQSNLNAFIFTNKVNKVENNFQPWVNKDVLYREKSEGGFGMIRVDHFFQALKCSWIKRYVVNAVDDHWGDMLDLHLKLTPDTREDLLLWGAEKLNSIISKKIPCISSFLASYKILKENFPTAIECMDNRWLTQPVFYNHNISMKNIKTKNKKIHLVPGELGLTNAMCTTRLCDLYINGTFKSKAEIAILNKKPIIEQSYHS